MKSIKIALGVVLLALLSVVPAQAQQGSPLHYVSGQYFSSGYASWQGRIVSGNSTTGAGTSIIVAAPAALQDGYNVNPATVFNTNTPIQIQDANTEIFTPTGVTIGPCPSGFIGVGASNLCATLTATIANTHGASAVVTSGDQGIEEAITDAGNQGGGLVFWQADTGLVTLSTSALTTTTTTKVPTQFVTIGASARVTTTITTSTNWAVGISGGTSAFCTVNATLIAGTTCVANVAAATQQGTTQALTAVLITVTGANAGAGVVKARVWGQTSVQASF